MPVSRRRFELLCLCFGLVIPFVLFYGVSLATSRSTLPLWRRLVTGEDTCPYFICLLVPLVSYVLVRLSAGFVRDYRAWRLSGRP